MDTRLTRFKYSSFNKFLCAAAAAVLAGVIVLNIFSVMRYACVYDFRGVLTDTKPNVYYSNAFKSTFSQNVDKIIEDVIHNENQVAYDEAKAKTVDGAFLYYLKIKEQIENENSEDETVDYNEDYSGVVYETTMANQNSVDYSYAGDTTVSFYYEIQDPVLQENGANAVRFEADYTQSGDVVKQEFATQFGNQAYNLYCGNTNDAGEAAGLGLKNIKYYAISDDGYVVTNVSSPEDFIFDIQNGIYQQSLVLENGGFTYSGDMEQGAAYIVNDYYGNSFNSVTLYLAVNDSFSEDDVYKDIYEVSVYASNIDVNRAIMICIVSFIIILILAVCSVRLAGNLQNGEVKASGFDKIPADLHFVLMGGAVGLIVAALVGAFHIECYDVFSGSGDIQEINYYCNSYWYKTALLAAGAGAYLVILNFACSISRGIKAKIGVFRGMLICRIFRFIIKVIRKIFGAVSKSAKKTKAYFNLLSFAPERLDKRSVAAVALFALMNILVTALVIAFIVVGAGWISLFLVIALIAADAYCVKRAFEFMRTLDMLIDKSAKNEPIEADIAKMPECLAVLAKALDDKNTELQNAVIKAVKDEHTKTELITNVSHDLKTPLTSVINYIDLLSGCDIQDETAQKYMSVIAEKANRLKRLIEDLIEASKVSTGNVTLNKTKINLNELAAQAIVEETSDIEKNHLQIVFDESVGKHIVFADGTKIYRVFENLLSNARKYSAPGSRIYARLYDDGDFGCFEIKNISKEPLNISAEELTQRFVRGDKSRSEEGNGLGLSIAKELCSLNGGKLVITIDGDLFKATVRLPKENTQSGGSADAK